MSSGALTRSPAPRSLIGRGEEFGVLQDAYRASLEGDTHIVFVSGEPGIGKTHLLDHFVTWSSNEGALTLRGNCYEDAAMAPYVPFVEALRPLATGAPDAGPGETGLAAALPSAGSPPVPREYGVPSTRQNGDERLRLFDAVARWFIDLANDQPVVLLLDDLHWADEPTALLLRYVARVVRAAPLLIVGAYRDTDLDTRQPFEGVLRDLQRERIAFRLALRRLDLEKTSAIVSELLAVDLDEISPAFLSTIQHESEGVPFLSRSSSCIFARSIWWRRDRTGAGN
ncbi:MAG: ATP-binding protein [Thermomicrobiales bacterium]